MIVQVDDRNMRFGLRATQPDSDGAGKGWFTILRLYGAIEPWFDKTWRPAEIELVK